jgi:ABC-type multidrug transport system permease subunit
MNKNQSIVYEAVGEVCKHIEILIQFFQKTSIIIIIGDLVKGDKKFKFFQEHNNYIEYLNVPISRLFYLLIISFIFSTVLRIIYAFSIGLQDGGKFNLEYENIFYEGVLLD